MYKEIPKPDVYVYLFQDTKRLLENIEKRGRAYEQNIDPAYLEQIRQGYFRFFKQQNDFPILVIDTNNIDFVHDETHFRQLLSVIFETDYSSGINRVLMD